jgi:uncharacterized membrane protein YgdD (TMEM256/DUF423 family)
MTLHPQVRRQIVISAILLALAVLIGAFGAHGLKKIVTPDKLETFETGVRYHFYHGFALLLVALTQGLLPMAKLSFSFYAFLVGILLFSFNCYFYVLSGIKIFALMVPLGGVLFAVAWLALAYRISKLR